jgi:hypothetical protein
MGLMYYMGKSILRITAKIFVQAVFEDWTLFSAISISLPKTTSLAFDNLRPVV